MGQFRWPSDVCEANGVLFVAEWRSESNRVQTFTITVNAATRALILTPRSVIGSERSPLFKWPRALICSPDDSRVFVADQNRISCIDVKSDAVRSFVDIKYVDALRIADGRMYVAHANGLSVVDVASCAVRQSALTSLHGHSWKQLWGIDVLSDFICLSDWEGRCLHVIPRQ